MTTIPCHPVNNCRNIYTRLDVLDAIDKQGILRGPIDEVKVRLRTYKDGEMLVKEFDHYVNRTNCCTCFWKLLYERLPVRFVGSNNDDTQFIEVLCNREELEQDVSMDRFIKQKTDPLKAYAYCIEDSDDAYNNCLVRILFKTESGKVIKNQLLDHSFPQGSVVRKCRADAQARNEILGASNCVKHNY